MNHWLPRMEQKQQDILARTSAVTMLSLGRCNPSFGKISSKSNSGQPVTAGFVLCCTGYNKHY